jgi:hypothetical protein
MPVSLFHSEQPTSSLHLAAIPEEDTTLVYEEIKGIDPLPTSIAVPEPTSASAASNYEDVKSAAHDVAESERIHHFTQCSAYGVATHGN